MLDWINENRVNNLNSRLETKLVTENAIPLQENTGDSVFMITVHRELDNSQSLLKDIKRILKKDRKILIYDCKKCYNKHCV